MPVRRKLPTLVFVRKRTKSTKFFKAGDRKIFESQCGRYQIHEIRGFAGMKVDKHFKTLWHADNTWQVIDSELPSMARAIGSCREHAYAAQTKS